MRSFIRFLIVGSALLLSVACTTVNEQGRSTQLNEYNDAAVLNLELGLRYFQQGNLTVAEDKFQKSIAFDNSIPETHNVLGVLYEETGRSTSARSSYRRAIELDGSFGVARMNYGRMLCIDGEIPQGLSEFRQVIDRRLVDDMATAYAGMGTCQLAAGDIDTARENLTRALELNRNHAAALLSVARYELLTGDARAARSFLDRRHSVLRENAESLWVAMEIEVASGNSAARDAYELRIRTDFPDSAEADMIRSRSGSAGKVDQ